MNTDSILDSLPQELLDITFSYLDAPSICAVRLSSRTCRDVVEATFLRRFFRTLSIDWTPACFEKLDMLASDPTLSPAVRNLHLKVLHYPDNPASSVDGTRGPSWTLSETVSGDAWSKEAIKELSSDWAAQKVAEQGAFRSPDACETLTRIMSNFGQLNEISLEANVVLNETHRLPATKTKTLSWRRLWSETSSAYRVLLTALSRSQISLQGLIVLEQTQHCSIPTREVAFSLSRLRPKGLDSVLKGLAKLSMSLALPVHPSRTLYREPDRLGGIGHHAGRAEESNDHNTGLLDDSFFYESSCAASIANSPEDSGLAEVLHLSRLGAVADFLHLMPQLMSLRLHLHSGTTYLRSTPPADDARHNKIFDTWLSDSGLYFPQLKHISLNGFQTTSSALTGLLDRHPELQSLGLHNMGLAAASKPWNDILAATSRSRISVLRVSNLAAPDARSMLDVRPAGPSNKFLCHRHDMSQGFCPQGTSCYWYVREIREEELRGHLQFQEGWRPDCDPMSRREACWTADLCVDSGPLMG